jgi:ABC-type sugar transport system ATPase subunit
MIQIEDLTVRAGSFTLERVSLEVPTGQHAFLMGKTGSGKTTLVEAVCGLRRVQSGAIRLLGREVTRLSPAERGIGFVPQDAALFSHLTVREHLSFALRIRAWPPAAIAERVGELAEWLDLGSLLPRKAVGLSGGEAQRVALGRALSFRPGVLCLDEPLSALDEDTRSEMCAVLRRVRDHTGVTILHVTHSAADAQRLADCVFFLREGRIARDRR